MTNLIYQGKITRQFWGKLIRQSTAYPPEKVYQIYTNIRLQHVTWGGAV